MGTSYSYCSSSELVSGSAENSLSCRNVVTVLHRQTGKEPERGREKRHSERENVVTGKPKAPDSARCAPCEPRAYLRHERGETQEWKRESEEREQKRENTREREREGKATASHGEGNKRFQLSCCLGVLFHYS